MAEVTHAVRTPRKALNPHLAVSRHANEQILFGDSIPADAFAVESQLGWKRHRGFDPLAA